jgi:hypothetical protein
MDLSTSMTVTTGFFLCAINTFDDERTDQATAKTGGPKLHVA